MTRELYEIAKRYAHDELKDSHSAVEDVVAAAFIDGAEWADAHPQHIEIPVELSDEIFIEEAIKEDWKRNAEVKWKQMEMYYFNKFLDKACKWLKDYAYMFVSETTGDLYEYDLINEFRKDMKGE